MMKKFFRAKNVLSHAANLRRKIRAPIRIAVIGSRRLAAELGEGAAMGAVKALDRADSEASDFLGFDLVIWVVNPGDKAIGSAEKSGDQAAGLAVFDARRDPLSEASQELALRLVSTGDVAADCVLLVDSDLRARLVPKALEKIGDKKMALASAVPIFRSAVAAEIIAKTALQNGGIAAISFIPGSDMPVLTANQLKMLLELMVVYGEEPSLAKLKEVLAVIGGGYALRAIARELLDLLPGPGWLIKGGVAFAGTIAVGKAAQAHFERGRGGEVEPLAANRGAFAEGGEARPVH